MTKSVRRLLIIIFCISVGCMAIVVGLAKLLFNISVFGANSPWYVAIIIGLWFLLPIPFWKIRGDGHETTVTRSTTNRFGRISVLGRSFGRKISYALCVWGLFIVAYVAYNQLPDIRGVVLAGIALAFAALFLFLFFIQSLRRTK